MKSDAQNSQNPQRPNGRLIIVAACWYESPLMPRGASTVAATTITDIATRPPNIIPAAATTRFGIRFLTDHFSSTAPDE